jgi:hypothetical protein
MKATRPQIIDLKARLWPNACVARGWDPNDRDWQMAVLSQILKRPISSSNDIEYLAEFTEVKATLEAWAHDTNLKKPLRTLDNPRRVLTTKITIDQVKLLSVCLRTGASARAIEPDIEAAQTYVAKLMKGRFRTDDITQISDQPTIRPNGEEKSDLETLRDTLDARISALRLERVVTFSGLSFSEFKQRTKGEQRRFSAESGWNWHDLRTKAGVECECAACKRKAAASGSVSRKVSEPVAA